MIEKIGVDSSLSLEKREESLFLIKKTLSLIKKESVEIKKESVEIKKKSVESFVFLQTCNRVELYRGDGEADLDLANHLFRVVTGLNSAMIGENHIQGQVRRAYLKSVEDKTISAGLHRLFQVALRTGKRARSETNISKGAVSYSHASCTKLRELGFTKQGKSILIIGVNSLTKSIVKFLKVNFLKVNSKAGFKADLEINLKDNESCKITICNRTASNVKPFVDEFGCHQLLWENRNNVTDFDAVISATSSNEAVILDSFYKNFSSKQLIIDLAVPRDFEPKIGKINGVTLLNLEDIEKSVNSSLKSREESIKLVEKIIDEELKEYKHSFLKKGIYYENS